MWIVADIEQPLGGIAPEGLETYGKRLQFLFPISCNHRNRIFREQRHMCILVINLRAIHL